MRYAQIIGWGMSVPSRVLTNDDLAATLETSDAWIRDRTGIAERRIAGPKDTTGTLATAAAWAALDVAGISPRKLGLIIVATVSPDYGGFPATACVVQDALGASHAGAFDLQAGCTGFVYGLSLASQIIEAGGSDYILVIGAETLSRFVDYTDRGTCILFGDGAGAVVLGPSARPGILAYTLGSDGSGADALSLPAGGSRLPASHETVDKRLHYAKMDGHAVYRFAVGILGKAAEPGPGQGQAEGGRRRPAHPASGQPADHRVRGQVPEAAARKRSLSTWSATGTRRRPASPSPSARPSRRARVHADDCLVLTGFGTGLTWGAVVLRWGAAVPLKVRPAWLPWWRVLRHRLAAIRSLLHRVWRRLDALAGRDGE